jgi:hypothetical protein
MAQTFSLIRGHLGSARVDQPQGRIISSACKSRSIRRAAQPVLRAPGQSRSSQHLTKGSELISFLVVSNGPGQVEEDAVRG